ncbi:MAG: Bug family tripartite tricarboxylate transporter substrate binding protein [Burkholderiales bacterium]
MISSARFKRVLFLLVAAACAGTMAPGEALAQAFPSRPIRIVLPFAGGGALDNTARALAKSLTETLGQTVLVDNRPGGNSVIGTLAVARSAPDGYTLLVHATAFVIVPSMMQTPTYDPLRDFVPIGNITYVSQVLVVNPDVPARNMTELILLAKQRPGELNYGSGGAGTSSHMANELLMRQAGIRLTHVPYKGNAPALVDVLGGRLQLMSDNLPTALQHVASGRLRALGVTSAKRSPLLPDVPAIGEVVPGYEASIFQGLFAPAGTPRDIVARIHAGINRFTTDPTNRESQIKQGVELDSGESPERFAAKVAADHEKWTSIVRQAGIKAE